MYASLGQFVALRLEDRYTYQHNIVMNDIRKLTLLLQNDTHKLQQKNCFKEPSTIKTAISRNPFSNLTSSFLVLRGYSLVLSCPLKPELKPSQSVQYTAASLSRVCSSKAAAFHLCSWFPLSGDSVCIFLKSYYLPKFLNMSWEASQKNETLILVFSLFLDLSPFSPVSVKIINPY